MEGATLTTEGTKAHEGSPLNQTCREIWPFVVIGSSSTAERVHEPEFPSSYLMVAPAEVLHTTTGLHENSSYSPNYRPWP